MLIQNLCHNRRWKRSWIGHTLRKPTQHITRQALTWNPQGKKKRGRPINIWHRALDAEMAQAGWKWKRSLLSCGYLRPLLHGVSRFVVDTRLVQGHVHTVAEVVTERRHVEDSPAAVVRDIHAIILVVRYVARVHLNIACNTYISKCCLTHQQTHMRLILFFCQLTKVNTPHTLIINHYKDFYIKNQCYA